MLQWIRKPPPAGGQQRVSNSFRQSAGGFGSRWPGCCPHRGDPRSLQRCYRIICSGADVVVEGFARPRSEPPSQFFQAHRNTLTVGHTGTAKSVGLCHLQHLYKYRFPVSPSFAKPFLRVLVSLLHLAESALLLLRSYVSPQASFLQHGSRPGQRC